MVEFVSHISLASYRIIIISLASSPPVQRSPFKLTQHLANGSLNNSPVSSAL